MIGPPFNLIQYHINNINILLHNIEINAIVKLTYFWLEVNMKSKKMFGELISERRKDLQLKLRELAEAVGIQTSYLSKLEHDSNISPSFTVVMKLTQVLGIDRKELLESFDLYNVSNEQFLNGDTQLSVLEKKLLGNAVDNIIEIRSNPENLLQSLIKILNNIEGIVQFGKKHVENYFVVSYLKSGLTTIFETPIINRQLLNYYFNLTDGLSDKKRSYIFHGSLYEGPEFLEDMMELTLDNLIDYATDQDDIEARDYIEKIMDSSKR